MNKKQEKEIKEWFGIKTKEDEDMQIHIDKLIGELK